MSRRAARVTQAEVENVVKGVRAAGVRVAEVRILPDWTIRIMSQPNDETEAGLDTADMLYARLRGEDHGGG